MGQLQKAEKVNGTYMRVENVRRDSNLFLFNLNFPQETIFINYRSIEFFPNKFHEYLLGPEVGFSHSYLLGIPTNINKGFRRPIQVRTLEYI